MTQEKRSYYRKALVIAAPIMIQNGITTFVSMLDNLMVGQVGTEAMSGVAIANQLVNIWIMMLFGAFSGIGIFTAQYYGKQDGEGIRYTLRMELYTAVVLLIAGIGVFTAFGTPLIRLYLTEDTGSGSVEETLLSAQNYMRAILFSFAPEVVTQAYSTTLRSCGETKLPMRASMMAVLINLFGNYILIYGKFGVPALGVTGAAIATVISRFVEMAYILIYLQMHSAEYPYIRGTFRSLRIPGTIVKQCLVKGMPLMFNETLWSMAQAALAQCYSMRGLSVVAAYNICQTIGNVFSIAFISMGSAIGIILGQELGSGEKSKVKANALSLSMLSLYICLITSLMMALLSGVFPKLYNTTEQVRRLASGMILLTAIFAPLDSFANAFYFTLRSGGQIMITIVFDSLFCWVVQVPIAALLVRFTALPILAVYAIVLASVALKSLLGYYMVRQGKWIRDLTNY